MTIETVTPQYVNQPKPGKKMGSIKLDDGRYLGVYPDKLHLYQSGVPITVEYDSNEVNGRTFFNVRRVVDAGTPAFTPSNGEATPAASGNNKSEEMFVMGFLNRFYDGAGAQGMTVDQVSADEIATLIRKLRFAWSEGFSGDASAETKTTAQELNDEIPF